MALGASLAGGLDLSGLASAAGTGRVRRPDYLPDPRRAMGEPTDALPFEHIVIVMQENHSFDSYLGMLSRHGQPLADGFTFDANGVPMNSNPYEKGYVRVQHAATDCTPNGEGSQSWNDTHLQIADGKMDGFAVTGVDSMLYWDQSDHPFYYSLANTFCLANRWFCSAPCQTYPNRRFLQAGTAFGLISTDTSTIFEYPPNGTIWDRLDAAKVSWANYFSDLPTTGIIAKTIEKYPQNITPIAKFYADCAAGTLPSVSMVDSDEGVVSDLSGLAQALGSVPGYPNGFTPSNINQDEENGNTSEGENFVSGVVNAVLSSPLWPNILLVWLYDEHGGNYDHVPPPAAPLPDNIAPILASGDQPGTYGMYGPRVPAVVVSGYAKPHAVTNVVHDHTSILATIEEKWNIAPMTHRDAQAASLADFLVTGEATFPEPPKLAAPSSLTGTQDVCTNAPLNYVVYPNSTAAGASAPAATKALDALSVVTVARHSNRLAVKLRVRHAALRDVEVELLHGKTREAVTRLAKLAVGEHTVFLEHRGLKAGRYEILVKAGGKTLLSRTERLTAAPAVAA